MRVSDNAGVLVGHGLALGFLNKERFCFRTSQEGNLSIINHLYLFRKVSTHGKVLLYIIVLSQEFTIFILLTGLNGMMR